MNNGYSPRWFETFSDTIEVAQTRKEVDFLSRMLPLPSFTDVLDVCCGGGRHARMLAERDYRVTAIDINAAMIDRARRESISNAQFFVGDMRKLEAYQGTCDAVICLWQSFGHFDEQTNLEIMRGLHRCLRPAGRLVLDVYNRAFFEAHQGTRTLERSNAIIKEHKVMHGDRLRVELEYADGLVDQFDWQLFTPDDLTSLAASVGLAKRLICREYNEKMPPSVNVPRMQLLFEPSSTPAQKKPA